MVPSAAFAREPWRSVSLAGIVASAVDADARQTSRRSEPRRTARTGRLETRVAPSPAQVKKPFIVRLLCLWRTPPRGFEVAARAAGDSSGGGPESVTNRTAARRGHRLLGMRRLGCRDVDARPGSKRARGELVGARVVEVSGLVAGVALHLYDDRRHHGLGPRLRQRLFVDSRVFLESRDVSRSVIAAIRLVGCCQQDGVGGPVLLVPRTIRRRSGGGAASQRQDLGQTAAGNARNQCGGGKQARDRFAHSPFSFVARSPGALERPRQKPNKSSEMAGDASLRFRPPTT